MSAIIIRYINTIGWHRLLIAFVIVWLFILFYAAVPMLNGVAHNGLPGAAVDARTADKLARALADLDALRHQNNELQEIFKEISLDSLKGDQKTALENFQVRLTKAEHGIAAHSYDVAKGGEPSTNYELLRRRIAGNTQEFWNFMRAGLVEIEKKVQSVSPEVVDTVKHLLSLGVEHKRSLLHDIDQLAEVDGYAIWRENESNDLSELVQRRFDFLQNPGDCATAKKLVCTLNKGCGYGCQLHHAVYCFMVAYGTQRTLILKSRGWRYHKAGWEDIFQPISNSCTDASGDSISNWPGNAETQVLNLPILDSLSPRPPYLPLTIPEDLAPRLTRLHGNPIVWWVGQILKYLLRPQAATASLIQEAMTRTGFQRPIVGIHVRRTDKIGTEAAFHSLDEYMQHVDEYYNQLELKQDVPVRRIYLASDDPKVLIDAKSKYPNYEVLGDPNISKSAAISTRYSDSSLFGIINDIHMLAMSDYLVCTFSSQVCRMAYEIMQNYFADASFRFKSLDDIYYYGGQNAHNVRAVLAHAPKRPGEMTLDSGDLIGVAGNHWNGFSKGRNLRTNQVALFPSFKVNDRIETAKFPTYAQLLDDDNSSSNKVIISSNNNIDEKK